MALQRVGWSCDPERSNSWPQYA